jgi:hypothetical protein
MDCMQSGSLILAEKMALFEPGKVTVHIYSLSPAPIRVRLAKSRRYHPATHRRCSSELRTLRNTSSQISR